MKGSRTGVVIAILLITLGTAWLLEIHNVGAPVSWPWPLVLTVTGVLMLILAGINKLTVVLGPFLLISAATSVLYQTHHISGLSVVPCLIIAMGILILLAYLLPVPVPEFMKDEDDAQAPPLPPVPPTAGTPPPPGAAPRA